MDSDPVRCDHLDIRDTGTRKPWGKVTEAAEAGGAWRCTPCGRLICWCVPEGHVIPDDYHPARLPA